MAVTTTITIVEGETSEWVEPLVNDAKELWAGMGCNEAQVLFDLTGKVEEFDRDGTSMVITLTDGRYVVLNSTES